MKHLLLTTIAAVVLVGCGPNIHEAVEAGNIEVVKQAIAAGKDVNSEDECCGATPLHYATRWGRKEIAELLIAKGADVNAKAKYGDTPLHGAIYANGTYLEETGRKEMIELLIAKGADVNNDKGSSFQGETPLHAAVWNYRKEVVELLIANGADVNAGYKNEHSKKNPMIGTIIPGAIHSGTEVIVPINMFSGTPLDLAIMRKNAVKFTKLTGGININAEIADLLRKPGGKKGEEVKAEDK